MDDPPVATSFNACQNKDICDLVQRAHSPRTRFRSPKGRVMCRTRIRGSATLPPRHWTPHSAAFRDPVLCHSAVVEVRLPG